MITKHYTLTADQFNSVEQIIREVEVKSGGQQVWLDPISTIIKVDGDSDAYFYFYYYGEDETKSNGIVLTAGNEYTFDRLEVPVYKIKILGVDGITNVRISFLRYICVNVGV